ncbi:MAG: reprolysin-like metallopeptidase [Bacteroidota bacterium]
MKRSILFLLLAFVFSTAIAQSSSDIWTTKQVSDLNLEPEEVLHYFATDYRLVEINPNDLAPLLLSEERSTRPVTIPKPDGTSMTVRIRPVSVMAPELAERYPGIQTFEVLPDGGKVLGGRVGWTYQGFHATVRTTQGTIYVDPYAKQGSRYYVTYNVEDNLENGPWEGFVCDVTGEEGLDIGDIYSPAEVQDQLDRSFGPRNGASIVQRRYRLAMACTGEFSDFHDGDIDIIMSAIATIVNRVNEVFGRDLAIQLELVANNDEIIFLDRTTDPYENETDEMLADNPGVLASRIGNENYDIGHVISTGPFSGQGVASLRGVCRNQFKGAATSTRNAPQGDPFVINILCHEMGHQFGGTHVQSGCQNVSIISAVEPGGGTTIMGYAGICPNGYNIATNSDDYYNNSSLEQMIEYSRNDLGNACAEQIDEGNSIPDITEDYENGFHIPISTPFELTASATDMEEDPLTYNWEQADINSSFPYDDDNGVYGPFPGQPIGNSPLFRSFPPTSSPTRVFPQLQKIVNNQSDNTETLPTYSRAMTFRCTVRDNHPTSGGAAWVQVNFRAAEEAGPFLVNSPNAGNEEWAVGDYVEVTWDVANSDMAPVNCQRVNIRLSTDGGFTYPITLLSNTPNDGSAFVTVPDAVGNEARVRVEAADNIFFDISNDDFEIVPATEAGYTLESNPLFQEVCVPEETAVIDIMTASILDYDSTITLEILTDLAAEGIVGSFDNTEIQPGENASLNLDFSGSTFDGTLSVEIQASTVDQGSTTRTIDIEVYNNDFSALALQTPADGSTGIVLSAEFSWTDLPNAFAYDFEIATNPAFGEDDLLEAAGDLTEVTFTPDALFESNTLYFWRIRPINECGPGPWSVPFTFHTENAICESSISEDTPITIPGAGPLPTRISSINVDFQGTISDINIPYIDVAYQPIQNFQVRLRSPDNIEVLLYDGNCFSTDLVNIGFDDDSPLEIQCPPTNQSVYQPVEALSLFNGEDTEGEWQLEVQILETGFGVPGSLDDWEIEFCASGGSDAPSVERNTGLCVRPEGGNPITNDLLAVEDASQNSFQLEYTVVTVPAYGDLFFLGEVLEVGDIFRQSSVDAGNVTYVNTDGSQTSDSFSFVVEDGTGGFLPVTNFDITIDASCVVNNENLTLGTPFNLYPNPTNGQVTLQWGEATVEEMRLRVFNVQGQLMVENIVAKGTLQSALDLSNVPAGIYLVQIGQHVERVIVE